MALKEIFKSAWKLYFYTWRPRAPSHYGTVERSRPSEQPPPTFGEVGRSWACTALVDTKDLPARSHVHAPQQRSGLALASCFCSYSQNGNMYHISMLTHMTNVHSLYPFSTSCDLLNQDCFHQKRSASQGACIEPAG